MITKSCPVRIKAAGEPDGLPAGQFEAIVSVFGNIDSYGDVVVKGAFADTLAEWAASGDPIPVYYSHRLDDPDYNIGHVLEAKEMDEGLWIRAELDIADPAPTSKAPQVHRLLKGRRVKQFSFSYDIVEAGEAERENAAGETEQYYELRKLRLYEVGPTPIGANQETELLAVKTATEHVAREVKAGRVLSADNETAIRAAFKTLTEVVTGLDTHDQDPANGGPGTVDEDPTTAKSPVDEEQPAGKSDAPTPSPALNLAAATFDNYSAAYSGMEGA